MMNLSWQVQAISMANEHFVLSFHVFSNLRIEGPTNDDPVIPPKKHDLMRIKKKNKTVVPQFYDDICTNMHHSMRW